MELMRWEVSLRLLSRIYHSLSIFSGSCWFPPADSFYPDSVNELGIRKAQKSTIVHVSWWYPAWIFGSASTSNCLNNSGTLRAFHGWCPWGSGNLIPLPFPTIICSWFHKATRTEYCWVNVFCAQKKKKKKQKKFFLSWTSIFVAYWTWTFLSFGCSRNAQ